MPRAAEAARPAPSRGGAVQDVPGSTGAVAAAPSRDHHSGTARASRRPGLADLAWEVDTLAGLQQIRGKLLQAGELTEECEYHQLRLPVGVSRGVDAGQG
ncbi:hypothetical protein GCM10020001_112350 [Nonomuraea salmonea]